jgi:NAD(P)-dependent dehydrogenase (short-subunit alcohol dehydrogenase family)
MAGRLDGKVAVITGGASGMGRSTVFRFLEEGAKVVVADMNEETGAETMGMIAEKGGADNAVFLAGDVAEEAHIEALVALATSKFGRLDCMFSNAGIGGAIGSITETNVDEWDFSFDVLVRSVFLGMKHAGRVLKDQGEGGTIISTASIAGLSGGGGPHAYSAAKAAVINLCRSVATELAHFSIRVNAIAPGAIITPLMHSGHAKKTEEMAKKITPWPRLGVGDDIANMALFLASDESEYVTGQVMVVDGGADALGPRMWDNRPGSAVMSRAGLTRGMTGLGNTFRDV